MSALLLQVFLLIVNSVFGFLTIVLLMRFYMQIFRISFANQFGAFVVQLTNWVVTPLRRVLPGVWGLDLASLLPAYLLQVLVIALLFFLRGGIEVLAPEVLVPLVFWRAVLSVLRLSVYMLIGTLFLQAFLSWVMPHSPFIRLVSQVSDPFLRPLRRIVPPIAGFDLSPLIAILLAQIVLIFL
mgnify:CR=1 FL=1